MPRQARKQSQTGFMHLIVRGVGQQILFEETEDYAFFLKRLERYCLETQVRVCAYCLMENHVHLLVRDTQRQAALVMKKLGVSYAAYFNRKYVRKGHLFQDRYMSEAIDSEAYLLTVFRYILNNPRKAGLCAASRYPWSSYALYEAPPEYFDLAPLRELLGGKARYIEYINAENDDVCLEYDGSARRDELALEKLQKTLGLKSGTELQAYGKKQRNEALKALKEAGLSVRQIARLTGISRNIVQNA